jgi:hypothetical protein
MLILGAGIAVLQKGLKLTRPEYEIHAQHRADVVDRRTGHDDRNGRSRSRNQRSRSTGITGHVAPEYPIEQRARETVTNFRFTTMAMHRVKNGNVLVLNVARFCEEVCRAVESWCADVQNSQEVIDRMTDVLNIEDGRNGFTF